MSAGRAPRLWVVLWHMVLHVETYEKANSELMKYLQKDLGLSARDLPACLQSDDGCTSDMEVGEACSVRKMPENPVCGPTTSPYSSFRSWPKTPRMQNPGFMLKLKIETSRIRECRPVAAFPQICHAVNRTGTLHRQRGRGHNQL